MFEKQKCVFDIGGIGYKSLENIFVKTSNTTCNFCNKFGRVTFNFLINERLYQGCGVVKK